MNGRTTAIVGTLGKAAQRGRVESGAPETGADLVDFRTLVEWMPAVTYVDSLDEPVTTLYVSPQIEALVGVSPEEYVAKPGLWETFMHPEDRERAQEEYRKGRDSGEPFSFEYRIVRRDGQILWIRDEAVTVRDADGRPLFLQGVSLDVTELRRSDEASRRSAELLQATIESTADGILVVDNEGTTLFSNSWFARMWRIPPDLLETKSDERLLAFVLDQLVEPEAFLAKIEELYQTSRNSFDSLRLKDGRVFERFSRPLVHESRTAGRVWSFRDVTERRRAQAALRESEGRLARILETMAEGLLIVDQGGRITFANRAAAEILGEPVDEIVGRRYLDPRWMLTNADGTPISTEERAFARVRNSGQPVYGMEMARERPDGRRAVWSTNAAPLLDASGALVAVVLTLRDIAEAKQAERSLKEAEARYRTLVEQVPAVVYMNAVDDVSTALYVSPQYDRLLGYSEQERLADPELWVSRLHPDDREKVLTESLRTNATGDPFRMEYRLLAKDGRVVWVRDEALMLRDEAGSPLLWQGILLDVTERKRFEEQLRESLELLRKSDEERRRLLDRVVEAQEEERRRIAADIHDDSIQKMAAVGLRLEALRHRIDPPDRMKMLDQVQETVELSIQRLRHLMFELRPPALDRDGLAPALRQLLQELAEEAGLETHLEDRIVIEPPPGTRAIAYRIAQEALANVRKHSDARRVHALVESREEGLCVRIRDDGVGFDRATTVPTRGHLGLSAMRERAEFAGGWWRIETAPGTGTSVEFFLPHSPEDVNV